jgi:hypothetical protein
MQGLLYLVLLSWLTLGLNDNGRGGNFNGGYRFEFRLGSSLYRIGTVHLSVTL